MNIIKTMGRCSKFAIEEMELYERTCTVETEMLLKHVRAVELLVSPLDACGYRD